MTSNAAIAKKLQAIAKLYLMGTSDRTAYFKASAYNKAAEALLSNPNVKDYSSLPGIGKGILTDIQQIIQTGTCNRMEELGQDFPATAFELMELRGVGPKTAKTLIDSGITSLEHLRALAKKGKLNPKLAEALKEYDASAASGRLPRWVAAPIANILVAQLKRQPGVIDAKVAGSLRRWTDDIGDIDIVCCSNESDEESIMDWFVEQGKELAKGSKKSRIMLDTRKGPVQIDLSLVRKDQFGACLQYLTGSKNHNIALRKRCLSKGLKLNEYGVWKGDKCIASATEEEIYAAIGLPFHPPEIREGHPFDVLPKLVKSVHLTSDLHVHSTWSDGTASAEDMIQAAIAKGLKAVAIADHSYRLKSKWQSYVNELSSLKAKYAASIKVYVAVEANVDKDGNMTVPQIPGLDFIIAAIHTAHQFNPVQRLISAMRDPRVKIIAHPTGRQIGKRTIPAGQDWTRLFKEAASRKVCLEINASPDRMDLASHLAKSARKYNCKFVVTSDTHGIAGIGNLTWGVKVARRALIGKSEIINSMEGDNHGKEKVTK